MVRQFEQPHSRDAAIVLDLWLPAPADSARSENVELAVSFAATLAAELCRSGSSDVFLVRRAVPAHNRRPRFPRATARHHGTTRLD